MTQRPDSFLRMGLSYNFNSDKVNSYKQAKIDPAKFNGWSNQFMYQTTYGRFHSKDSTVPKRGVIPGYSGFIPSIKSENMYGRGFSALGKSSFKDQKKFRNDYGLETSGHNRNKQIVKDQQKVATSSKYGKSALQKAHHGWNGQWITTTRDAFKDPGKQIGPTYRQTQKRLQTEGAHTKTSGFSRNNDAFDGKGLIPKSFKKIVNSQTEYRDYFNAGHPYHRNVHLSKPPTLLKKYRSQNNL